MTNIVKHMKTKALIAGLIFAIAATAGNAIARSGTTAEGSDPAADVLARIGSSRVTAISATAGTAAVQGTASDSGADGARSLWYETLAGAAYAQRVGLSSITRRVSDPSGGLLTEETDVIGTGGPDAFAPLDRTAATLERDVRARAESVGARVRSSHFIQLYGGTAELVIQPNDPAGFVTAAGVNVAAVLGDLAADQEPYLVTLLDAAGRAVLVLGYTPSVGGGMGQGIGWQAPEVDSDAVWGATDPSHRLP
jgi:hypothetical protein